MFTGIVEEIGKIESISRGRNSAVLTISAEKSPAGDKDRRQHSCKWNMSYGYKAYE